VSNPQTPVGQKFGQRSAETLIDTGATTSVVSRALAHKLRLVPLGSLSRMSTVDGTIHRMHDCTIRVFVGQHRLDVPALMPTSEVGWPECDLLLGFRGFVGADLLCITFDEVCFFPADPSNARIP
jgi:hypothetical protein